MPPSRANEVSIGLFVTKLALIAVTCLGASESALAAEHNISGQAGIFECKSIKPGDTLTLASGTRGPLRIQNCKGTSSNPIVVRNDPRGNGPTVIRRTSGKAGGFILECRDCVDVAIDGSYKWQGAPNGKTYGIKVTMSGGGGPSAFVRIYGQSRFVTIRNVEIDGAWPKLATLGSGIRVNDLTIKRSSHPGQWNEGILIENNYIHDVADSGMYVGPNYSDGSLPLRNIEIRFNRVEDTGSNGILTKSMWSGDNRIHHNVIRNATKNLSSASASSPHAAIENQSGTASIYNNWIESTGQHGIQVWTHGGPKVSEGKGPFEAHIWNNVITDVGGLARSSLSRSYGISIGAQNGCEKPIPKIYSNTIAKSRQRGIDVTKNVGAGFVRDNIVAGASGNPVIAAPSFVDVINNRVGAVSLLEFVNPGSLNFHLAVGSPARNEGSAVFPKTDYDDTTRPKDGAADQGAYEGGG